MRFRSLLVACALPLAATGAVYGCSGEPAPEDLCGWLQNPDGVNCIAAFHEDIADKCGALDSATVSGTFATRKALDMCVLTGKGGSVVFDPPIELDALPTGMPTTMKLVNADGTGCGEVTYLSPFSWQFNVAAPPDATSSGTGSGTTTGTGGAAPAIETGWSKGTISVTRNEGDRIAVACPAPDVHGEGVVVVAESHVFNLNQVLSSTTETGCPQYSKIIPQAIFEIDPGGVQRAGALRLKIQYPPQAAKSTGTGGSGGATSSTSTGGSVTPLEPEVVYYFDCAIPAAPLVCANGEKDGSEVDVDCGGPETTPGCPIRCAEGQQCVDVVNSCDCDASSLCKVSKDGTKRCTVDVNVPLPSKGVCSQIICANQVKDTSESDVDCGGLCTLKCPEGKSCVKNEDCAGNSCTLGVCGPPRCDDKSTNGTESDVDCGGACPNGCDDGKKCNGNADCTNKGCFNGICSPCANGAKDGAESDVDCGGTACAPCAEGKDCTKASDCATNVCTGGKCNGCSNGVKDGKESDIDCGGAECSKCADGKTCTAAADCTSVGCLNGLCSQCADGMQNGTESDVDCGGGTCPKCSNGKVCAVTSDCANGTCEGFKCGSCADGLKDGTESDIDCGGACSTKCPEAKACTDNADCNYDVCVLPAPVGGVQGPGVCNTCTDMKINGTETDLNCGGATCAKCAKASMCKINLDCTSGICINKLCQ